MAGLLRAIVQLIQDAGATDEEDTERDGAFSYSGEVHAFAIGLAVGFAAVLPSSTFRAFVHRIVGLGDCGSSRSQAIREAMRESWYALGGAVFGVLLAIGVMAVAVALGLRLT